MSDTANKPIAPVSDQEPSATRDTAPLWLFFLTGAVFFTAAVYSDHHSANFDSNVYEPYPSAKYVQDIQPRDPIEDQKRKGRLVYEANCAACHQASGLGEGGKAPPLAGSEWVLANKPDRIIRIAWNGLTGPIEVKNQTWTLAMPNFGEAANLSDEDFSALLTYIRNSWGNKAPAVTPEQIAALRKVFTTHGKQWTADELKEIPVD